MRQAGDGSFLSRFFMITQLYAIKSNTTQTWEKNGKRLPVTVVNVPELTVTQIKTVSKDGYHAIQVGFGRQQSRRVNKPVQGHLKKSGLEPTRYIREIQLSLPLDESTSSLKVGDVIDMSSVINVGDIVKVSTRTKGTGFTGVMKRWGFGGGPRTHGQSDRERAPGSIGQGTTPGRVWKGKRMAGQDGNLTVTQQNLQVVKYDKKTGELWLKGTTPGHTNSLLSIVKTGHKVFVGLAYESSSATNKSDSNQVTESA